MLLSALLAAAAIATTVIPAEMVSTVSSSNAKIGDTFDFKTTAEERTGGIFIPAGTPGEGIVSAVSHASGTHRGSLTLSPQYLRLPDGRRIAVTSASPASFAARRHVFPFPVPLPGVLVVGGVENPGGDVTIGPGTMLQLVPASGTTGK